MVMVPVFKDSSSISYCVIKRLQSMKHFNEPLIVWFTALILDPTHENTNLVKL